MVYVTSSLSGVITKFISAKLVSFKISFGIIYFDFTNTIAISI